MGSLRNRICILDCFLKLRTPWRYKLHGIFVAASRLSEPLCGLKEGVFSRRAADKKYSG